MKRQLKDQLDVGLGCATFAREHPDANPTLTAAGANLDALNGRGSTLAARFESASHRWNAAVEGKDREQQEATRLLRAIQRITDYAATRQPEVAVRFRMPAHRSGRHAFVARAQAVVELITTNRELLAGYGMPDTMPEELGATLGRYEAFTIQKESAQQTRSAARAELAEVARQVMQQVRHLDGLYRIRYEDNPEVLSTWRLTRRLPRTARPEPVEVPADRPAA